LKTQEIRKFLRGELTDSLRIQEKTRSGRAERVLGEGGGRIFPGRIHGATFITPFMIAQWPG
jgi:hypothetical protein